MQAISPGDTMRCRIGVFSNPNSRIQGMDVWNLRMKNLEKSQGFLFLFQLKSLKDSKNTTDPYLGMHRQLRQGTTKRLEFGTSQDV